ncbi:uncharacterized protein LOC126561139 [Anopheles maculipalpis]|uniref:uncharacterized protein LOC126561139 n=1 Tax=Anopheles maculipalpis TaxID=1496333 RepID=UPI002159A617|nr:uncharacterized protein LOC126561139 [Anopheles maculipalpis]
MDWEFPEKILFSEQEKLNYKVYRLSRKIESMIDQEYDAEQAKIPIKIESESEDEQRTSIATNANASLLTNLKMTCSNNEDPFKDCDNTNHTIECPKKTILMSNQKAANALDLNALNIISQRIASIVDKITAIKENTDHMQNDMACISKRLGRVEKRVGLSLATLEQVKDSVVVTFENARPEDSEQSAQSRFVFKKLSTENELAEFNTKLGEDEEYWNNLKKSLLLQLPDSNPDNRMSLALDILVERSFFAECNWSGHSKNGPKIRFGNRTNVFKLFASIGSNKADPLSELHVQTFFKCKLKHAKERASKKGMVSYVNTKQKSLHS